MKNENYFKILFLHVDLYVCIFLLHFILIFLMHLFSLNLVNNPIKKIKTLKSKKYIHKLLEPLASEIKRNFERYKFLTISCLFIIFSSYFTFTFNHKLEEIILYAKSSKQINFENK